MTCQAIKTRAGQMRCNACRLLWDLDDPEPPPCPQEVNTLGNAANRQTVAGIAYQATRAAEAQAPKVTLGKAARLLGVKLGTDVWTFAMHNRLAGEARMHPDYNGATVTFFAVAEIARLAFIGVSLANRCTPTEREAMRDLLLSLITATTDDNFTPEQYNGLYSQD